jgi:hypothetical protein
MRRLTAAFLVLAFSLGSEGVLAADDGSPAAGTFSPADSLPEARMGHIATLLLDGRVLVIGGWTGDRGLASAEAWSP